MEVMTRTSRFLTIEECDSVNSFVETLKCRRSFDLGMMKLEDQAEIIQEWFQEWFEENFCVWDSFCEQILLEN